MWLYQVPGCISWLIKANLQTKMLNDVSGEAKCKVHAIYKYADGLLLFPENGPNAFILKVNRKRHKESYLMIFSSNINFHYNLH